MKSIAIDGISAHVLPEVSLTDAINEAIVLCIERDTIVSLADGQRIYRYEPSRFREAVTRMEVRA